MHAYDFILILFSFVYAAAVTHLLSTAGEIIIAWKRVRFSWLNAGWMLAGLAFTFRRWRREAAAAVQTLAMDPEWVGGQVGILAIEFDR